MRNLHRTRTYAASSLGVQAGAANGHRTQPPRSAWPEPLPLTLELNEPIRANPLPVNEFGLLQADFYRIGDVCRVLRISPDLLRWRLRAGKCPDSHRRDAKGRLFTQAEVRALSEL